MELAPLKEIIYLRTVQYLIPAVSTYKKKGGGGIPHPSLVHTGTQSCIDVQLN
jgi:hypothetical protein